jgi:hypothetical protein
MNRPLRVVLESVALVLASVIGVACGSGLDPRALNKSGTVAADTSAANGAVSTASALETVIEQCKGQHENHGQCVSCAAHALDQLDAISSISGDQKGELQSTFAHDCENGCLASTCAAENAACGTISNLCGGTLDCGACNCGVGSGVAPGGQPNQPGCTVTTVNVNAGAINPFTSSGVVIAPGASVVVLATGQWSVGGPYGVFDANGSVRNPNTESCSLAPPPVSMGTLIGSVDNGLTWFPIGTGPTTISCPGALLLAANDCPGPNGSFFSDNSGSVAVSITSCQ